MIFTRLMLCNFGVYRGRVEIDLRPRHHDEEFRPVILFGGKNGAGKTTLLEALRLCLYGRNSLGVRVRQSDYDAYITERLHRGSDGESAPKSAQVGLTFEHTHAGIRSTYRAIRSWHFSGTGRAFTEDVSIYQNNAPFREIAPEYWNDFLRDLIPPGVADLFFFDGEHIQTLASDETGAEALATAVRGLLNLGLIEQLGTDLEIYRRQNQQQGHHRLAEEERQAKQALDEVKCRLEERKQDRAGVTTTLTGVQAQLEQSRQRLVREGAAFIQQRTAIQVQLDEVTRAIDHAKATLRDWAGELLPFALVPRWCYQLRTRLDQEAAVERERLAMNTRLEHQSQVAQMLLDTGFQSSTRLLLHHDDWQRIADALQEQMPQPMSDDSIHSRHSLAEKERTSLMSWIDTATQVVPQQVHTLTMQLETWEAQRAQLEQSLVRIPADGVAIPLVDEFNQLSQRRGAIDVQLAQHEELVRQTQLEYDEKTRRLERARHAYNQVKNNDSRLQRAQQVQQLLDTYLTRLTEQKLQDVEQALTEYFNLLCRKQMLIREVRINRKDYTVTLYGENRSTLRKTDLSAGEKQLYATALLWALRSVSGRMLPVIVDTPMGRLDSDHRAAMLNYFFPHAAHQFILLSTDTEIDAATYTSLSPAISHAYRLDFNQTDGCTNVRDGYFVTRPEGVLV